MSGELPLIHVTPLNHTKANDFFSIFFKEHENEIPGCGSVMSYPSATEIFREDTPADVLYLIERGIVKLSQIGRDGKETIVGLRGRYWLLAAPAFFLGIPYTFAATTLTPCQLRAITGKCFSHLTRTDETFSWEVYRHLSQSIYDSLGKVVEVSRMLAEERLKTFLMQLIAELCPEKVEAHNHYQVPLKQRELADIIGVSPEHLCRLEKKLNQEGFIISTKGILTIRDVSKLFPLP